MFLFLPKLWELFTQIERSQQRAAAAAGLDLGPHMDGGSGVGFDNDGNEMTGDGSLDGFLYSNAAAAWMNSAGNLAVLGPGVTSAPMPGGSSTNASSVQLPMTSSGVSIGRKGSIGTLEESKGETSLKESHVGYMGVKYQNRFFSFLSSWCMKRVILYPAGRYFTCFDVVSQKQHDLNKQQRMKTPKLTRQDSRMVATVLTMTNSPHLIGQTRDGANVHLHLCLYSFA